MKQLSLLQYKTDRFKEALLFVILAVVFSILIVTSKGAVKDEKLSSLKANNDEDSADFPGGYKLNFIKWSMQ